MIPVQLTNTVSVISGNSIFVHHFTNPSSLPPTYSASAMDASRPSSMQILTATFRQQWIRVAFFVFVASLLAVTIDYVCFSSIQTAIIRWQGRGDNSSAAFEKIFDLCVHQKEAQKQLRSEVFPDRLLQAQSFPYHKEHVKTEYHYKIETG